jgi:hypothetical protein
MKATFYAAALMELNEAVAYYESQRAGLGDDFLAGVETALRRIEENPRQFPVLSRPVRRAHVRRFPFGLVYMIIHDHIWIVATMHLQRRPGYWKNRLP